MPSLVAVPSDLPEDLLFNAQKIDECVNSSALFYLDRFGVSRMTLAGVITSIMTKNARGAWVTATAYAINDLVTSGGTWYICVVAHTSAASFATDQASKWRVYQGVTTADLLGTVTIGTANITTVNGTTVNVGALTVSGATLLAALTANGNVVLGDASTDTLNVGAGGIVKDASNLVGIGTSNMFGRLTVQRDTANQYATLTVTDAATPANAVGFYLRQTAGDAGISTAGADLVVYMGGPGTTPKFRFTAAGLLDILTGSGSLRMNGGITRFESGESTCPSTATSSIRNRSHGGPRVPDIVQIVLRCKITEGGWAVGDEVRVDYDLSATNKQWSVIATATAIIDIFNATGPSTPTIRDTTGTAIVVTAANWRVVARAIWL